MNERVWASIQLLAHALRAPRALAAAIEEGRASWRTPALVIIGGEVALDLLTLPLFVRAVPQMAPPGLSPEMLAQLEQTARIMRPLQIALSPLGLLLKWAFVAALLFGMGLVLLGSTDRTAATSWRLAPARAFFTLVVHVSLITLIKRGVENLILWARYAVSGAIVLRPAIGLDALVRPPDAVWAVLLGRANPFELWSLAILTIGVSGLCHCSRRRAAAMVLPVWGMGVLAEIGLALVRDVLTRQLGA